MWSFKEIKQNYRFTEEDTHRLSDLRPLMEEHADAVVSTVALWINSTKGTAKLFTDESGRQHVLGALRGWFPDLFSGQYDSR